MRVALAACIAPCAAPLLAALCAWFALRIGAQSAELARWIRFGDLWSLFLGEYVVALVITWCAGFPIYAVAQSRHALSGVGICTAGTAIGAVIFFLIAAVASTPSLFSLAALISLAVGAIHGLTIALLFSVLAGIPRVAPRSMLLQRDVFKTE